MALREAKKLLRTKVRASLRALDAEVIAEQSEAVARALWGSELYRSCASIGIFLSMPQGEIQTASIIRQALADQKRVYVPRVGLDFEKFDMEMLRIDHLLSSADEIETMWPRNKWKIPEPPVLEGEEQLAYADGAASTIDLLIMPGVAFDRLGNRLGQGKGYYDRYLEKHSATPPTLVGIGLTPQFLNDDETIPVTEQDVTLNAVISPSSGYTMI
ncbi:hypothetical protein TrVE_jg8569 [Triparma verrucosa]|uniref:5-formyltetrahydrofolate cyclo-ligase n=1 Tax=Triparma verrucosa TaxID=1606542 RepID=A0A9W7FGI6_9STRA|nr:hypothetical protein TrVE_jg8569 [Triparma verrucosa]